MNVLALCAGAGGLEVGIRRAVPSSRVVAYVEREAAALEVLFARTEEGALDPALVWSDVRTFPARRMCGLVDLVAAGYPCQGESNAGKRLGTADERWLWDDIWRIVRDVGARYLFVENVAAHINRSFPKVLASLAKSGWHAEWDCVPAAAVGAPHQRDRFFMLAAHPKCFELRDQPGRSGGASGSGADESPRAGSPGTSPDADVGRFESIGGAGLLDSERQALGLHADGRDMWSGAWAGRPAPEPTICRVDDGLARSVDQDRLYVLGNGVVPQAAEYAWRVLWNRLHSI